MSTLKTVLMVFLALLGLAMLYIRTGRRERPTKEQRPKVEPKIKKPAVRVQLPEKK